MRIYYHRLGSNPAGDRLVLGKNFPRIAEVRLANGDGTSPLVASVANGDGGEFEHFAIPENGLPTRITRFSDKAGAVVGAPDGSLLILSYKDAPHGRILVLDKGLTDLSVARTLVPEGDRIYRPDDGYDEFRPLVVTEGRIYAQIVSGGPVDVAVFDRMGKFISTLPSSGLAAVGPVVPINGGKVLYGVVTYLDPFRFVVFDEATGATIDTQLRQSRNFDFSDCIVTREIAVAPDGTQIPISVIRRKDVPQNGTAPLLVWGYGGYGTIESPTTLSPATRIWLDAGGVYALANIRGGGDYGPAWHKAGHLTRKQTTFDDFAAVVRHLVNARWGAPNRVALRGGSNGGLLMGAMIIQHPELARAVLSEAGIYDMLREENFPNGAFNVTEFGTVKNPEQFRALFAYSPYHHVVKGTSYPAVLLTADADDNRVNPMQSRKMTAALQWATSGSGPILLRTTVGTGHSIGIPVDAGIAAKAATYAFLFRELGMTVVVPAR